MVGISLFADIYTWKYCSVYNGGLHYGHLSAYVGVAFMAIRDYAKAKTLRLSISKFRGAGL